MSKQEATRLADALGRAFTVYGVFEPSPREKVALEAADLLRRWPDGEPYCYIYEWDTAGGVHRDTTLTRWNGAGPVRSIPVYTAPPAESERIAERKWLDNECLDGGCQSLKWHERIAALEAARDQWHGYCNDALKSCKRLEAALEQARVALEGLLRGCKRSTIQGLTGWHEKSIPSSEALDAGQDALRKIEEVQK